MGLLERVELDFSQLAMPADNAFIDVFNGCFRQKLLNENWLLYLEDAEEKVESRRRRYNGEKSSSGLGDLSPGEFAA